MDFPFEETGDSRKRKREIESTSNAGSKESRLKTQASDLESCIFPRVRASPAPQKLHQTVYRLEVECHDIISAEAVSRHLMTAWSILLAKYTGANKIRFGVLPESGTNQYEAAFEEWCASWEPENSTADGVDLTNVCEWSFNNFKYRGRFNSCIAQQPKSCWFDAWTKLPDHPIELVLLVEMTGRPHIELYSRSLLLDEGFLALLSAVLRHVLLDLTSDRPLQRLNMIPDEHRKQISDWNESVPKEPLAECIHQLIRKQCDQHPDSQAVCAWDGNITYFELESLSSNVTKALHRHDIGPETVVPILFEKSKWTVVAILGTLKAGAAFVLLDPTHPLERLQGICRDVRANVILTSEVHQDTSSKLATTVIMVPGLSIPAHTEDIIPLNGNRGKCMVNSSNVAYVSYTSGSTGKPKGIVIEHASVCTNAMASSEAQNLNGSSRVLQFASYAFDVSIHEILIPLILGGCVCIPSEMQRVNNLQEAIISLRVNWMELTPSVARILNPDEIPAVKTLVVGGESMPLVELTRWASRVRLIVAYGPAECTIVSTVQTRVGPDCDPSNIGRGYGGTTWVVDSEDHDSLVPIGTVGELVIGGPIVAREYLGLPQQTKAAFVTNPPWATGSKFYKTGDLDTQVKLRGQRIELGEIEHHAGDLFQGAAIAVEMGKLHKGQSVLVLFVEWAHPKGDAGRENDDRGLLFRKPDQLFSMRAHKAKTALTDMLPRYMVPDLIVPLSAMPLSQTAKVDRKALRGIISQLSKSDLNIYRFSSKHFGRQDETNHHNGPLEDEFVKAIARTLSLDPRDIMDDDDFFHLGGDSISAIMLAAETKKHLGLNLTVTDIFQYSTISELRKQARKQHGPSSLVSLPGSVLPFSMLGASDIETFKKIAVEQCGILPSQIEDIYPCSPLQERFMARTARQPGAFQARFAFRMSPTIDWNRLRRAWNIAADAYPILRTRIINAAHLQLSYSAFQVVVRGWNIEWLETYSNTRQIDGKWEKNMLFGTPLIYLIACRDSSRPGLTLVMHHSLFDWWSYNKILDAVQVAYEGQRLDPGHFSPFIKYIHEQNKSNAKEFWKREFHGLKAVPSFSHSFAGSSSHTVKWTHKDFPLRLCNQRGATISAMIRLAWAMVVSQHTGLLDVDHNTALIPFEQTGIQEIQQASPEAAMACEFQSLLVQVQSMLQSMGHLLGLIADSPHEKTGSILGERRRSMGKRSVFQENKLLASVESAARGYLGTNTQVAAEWIIPKSSRTSKLALFIGVNNSGVASQGSLILTRLGENTRNRLSQLMLYLRAHLPRSSVPSCCIPVQLQYEPPKSCLLGELARLREAASKTTLVTLRSWENAKEGHYCRTPSPVESKLTSVLASVLRLESDDIDADDDFVSLGCDSLVAMQFAARCNRDGLMVTISDIFEAKSVTRLALKLGNTPPTFPSVSNDFSLVRSVYKDLQRDAKGIEKVSKIARIVDAFPCTSPHLGLLPHDTSLQAHTIWEVSASGDVIDPFRLAEAWNKLADRHAALRTVLLQSRFNPPRMFQIVLASSPVEVEVVTDVEDQNIWPVVRKPFLSSSDRDELPCKFTIYRTSTGRILCKLEGRHAFLDATSVLIILQELASAYNGIVSSSEVSYLSWVSYLRQWAKDSSHLHFWKSYLAGIKPCILTTHPQESKKNGINSSQPHQKVLQSHSATLMQTDVLRRHCEKFRFSITNFFQVAWGLVLGKYTGLGDVCFGTLVSGRDAPVPHINDIVGPLFNVLVCRLSMPEHKSCHWLLKRNEAAIRDRLLHQYCSLKDVTRASWDSDTPLFNTSLSVEQPLSSEAGICFKELETHEETEV
ncbi:predicted protein [Uncinocarpus reesii 1704]|uniref:Carrier domain-containing protein n=1 Tax=Uncinocarpus reesii (strain UAMH 1704) TaxID=336963 RepID=C4JZR4_UNCRE|nr:uncharacterized protein UREG_07665 [Uncinocarpus reesii 1704]EEP82800.1 predicted protein [Uncinocarpus reesii 1704]